MKSHQFIYEDEEKFLQDLSEPNFNSSKEILVQIFSGDCNPIKIKKLIDILYKQFPKCHIIGTTSGKEVINSHLLKGSVTVSITEFEKTKLISKSFEVECEKFSCNCSKNLGGMVGDFLKENNAKAAISFVSILKSQFNGKEYLDEIFNISPKTVFSGGFSGVYDMQLINDFFVVHNKEIITDGIVVLGLLNEELEATSHYSVEWNPIGKGMEVTKAERNRIYEIDNRPALEIYKKYLGDQISDNLDYAGLLCPLFINRNGVNLIRIVSEYHDDGSISYPANFFEGDKVHFAVANQIRSNKNIVKSYKKIKSTNPEVIFCYSCMGRDSFLPNQIIEKEVSEIGKIAPQTGFQTFGEFYHNDTGNYMMNYASTFLLLRESRKNARKTTDIEDLEEIGQFEGNFELKILTHLLVKTSLELKKSNQRLKKIAIYDFLTKIYNRGKIERVIKKGIEMCKRKSECHFTLFLFDIDNFKQINDKFGHDVGDIVLKQLALEVSKNLRQVDYFGRWGGEEFMILLPNTKLDEAINLIDRITILINSIIFDNNLKITVSGGLSEYRKNMSFDELIKEVDNKLYKAKKSGKDKFIY